VLTLRGLISSARYSVHLALLRARLRRRKTQLAQTHHPLLQQPLVDLAIEREEFTGVLTPADEVGAPREGVDHVFLDDAEEYYRKYQSFDYWRSLIRQATERAGITDADAIVEFGCGFGNSTLPLLDLFPRAHVVATDISPNLLAILNRLVAARGLSGRCVAVAMDAQKDYVRADSADLVVGSAILHHLAEPAPFVEQAMRILRPGGAAIFFEPFEGGNAVLRLMCQEIVREAGRRKFDSPAVDIARGVVTMLAPQIFRDALPGWQDRNDKWAFPRVVIDDIARKAGASLTVYPLHDNVGQFRRHFAYIMQANNSSLTPADLPSWMTDVFDRYDRETFSPQMLTDLALEGCIIFAKPKAS
jgi:SAM-dependent methyltransferase